MPTIREQRGAIAIFSRDFHRSQHRHAQIQLLGLRGVRFTGAVYIVRKGERKKQEKKKRLISKHCNTRVGVRSDTVTVIL